MKLTSMEFIKFACFERITVPMREGITVLVGRNNSGKTALLRGLSLLSDFILEPRRPIRDFTRYVRDTVSGGFEMNVRLAAEQTDPTIFQGDDSSLWKEFVDKHSPEFVFYFSVWPEGPGVTLDACDLVTKDRSIRVWAFNSQQGTVNHAFYDADFKEVALTGIKVGQTTTAPNNKFVIQSLPKGPERQPFETLGTVRYVGPHRVAKPTTQLIGTDQFDSNAENLAAFLHTFRGDYFFEFQRLRDFVLSVFPQFTAINTHSSGDKVEIEMPDRATGNRVALSHCGTGVEQILSLATAVVSARPGSIVLLDEPHSYLHPIAERQLVQFLKGFPELTIVISTHSATIMNAVPADRIFYLKAASVEQPSDAKISTLLFDLGHRNSDLLLSDRLIFVEGLSDTSVLPILLGKSGRLSSLLETTGFLEMEGGGRLDGRTAQTSILYYEKIIKALGRAEIPHVYLFDGDKTPDDQRLIEKLKKIHNLTCLFLPRRDLENYLLIPDAIFPVLVDELRSLKLDAPQNVGEIKLLLDSILAKDDDDSIYPDPTKKDRLKDGQGSRALELLFDHFKLSYSKTKHGPRIADIIPKNHPELSELTETLAGFMNSTLLHNA